MKARTFIVILFILIFVMCAVGGTADDFDWPRWRGPNGDGISMETEWNPEALAGGPNLIWSRDIGHGCSNVVIKDNYLYTMGYQDGENRVFCLNAETGKEVWRHSYKGKFSPYGTQSTPTVDDKHIYTLSTEGVLMCLKVRNGKRRWEKDLVNEYDIVKPYYLFAGPPVIEGDLLIITANTSGIALNKNTGEMLWVSEKYHPSIDCHQSKDLAGYAAPVVYDNNGTRCALMYHCSGLFSVDIHTGKQQWFFEFNNLGANASDPVLFSNKVFLSTGYANARCTLIEITGNQPKALWQNKNMRNEFSACVYIDGYLYGSDGDNGKLCPLRCIDVQTGEVMWEKEMKMASLTAADGKLIILEEDGTLHIAQATPSSYKEISSCDVLDGERKGRQFWTPPVLCNGKIYCRNFAGDLICIDVSK